MYSKSPIWGLMAFLLTVAPQCLCAQSQSVPLKGATRVEIYLERASLEIEGHSGQDIQVEAEGYRPPPERAKGLRPLYNQAVDNTGMGLMVENSNGTVTIRKASSNQLRIKLKLPQNLAVQVEETSWMGGGTYKVLGYQGELEVKSNGSPIHLEQVTGPVMASSTSGSIDVIFSSINTLKPSAISNISGRVDVSIDKGTKATFHLTTISGEIYTDLDLDFGDRKDGMKVIGRRSSKGLLNGGGVELTINSISSPIYIRKSK